MTEDQLEMFSSPQASTEPGLAVPDDVMLVEAGPPESIKPVDDPRTARTTLLLPLRTEREMNGAIRLGRTTATEKAIQGAIPLGIGEFLSAALRHAQQSEGELQEVREAAQRAESAVPETKVRRTFRLHLEQLEWAKLERRESSISAFVAAVLERFIKHLRIAHGDGAPFDPVSRLPRSRAGSPYGELVPTWDGELLRPGEAARHLGISPATLRRWTRKGKIEPLTLPTRTRRYRKDDLDALIAPPTKGTPPPDLESGTHTTGS